MKMVLCDCHGNDGGGKEKVWNFETVPTSELHLARSLLTRHFFLVSWQMYRSDTEVIFLASCTTTKPLSVIGSPIVFISEKKRSSFEYIACHKIERLIIGCN